MRDDAARNGPAPLEFLLKSPLSFHRYSTTTLVPVVSNFHHFFMFRKEKKNKKKGTKREGEEQMHTPDRAQEWFLYLQRFHKKKKIVHKIGFEYSLTVIQKHV